MSSIRNYFQSNRSEFDELHKLLGKEPAIRAQLPPIRQALLGCCGASMGKGGKIELTISDQPRWDGLVAQEAAIMAKLQKIDDLVKVLDGIFAEIEAAGFDAREMTVEGIMRMAPRTDPPYQYGEYVDATGRRVGRDGKRIKQEIDPRFLTWSQKAEAAFTEVQKIIG